MEDATVPCNHHSSSHLNPFIYLPVTILQISQHFPLPSPSAIFELTSLTAAINKFLSNSLVSITSIFLALNFLHEEHKVYVNNVNVNANQCYPLKKKFSWWSKKVSLTWYKCIVVISLLFTWGGLFTANILTILSDTVSTVREMLRRGFSVNLYMFHGGSSFGFVSGALADPSYKALVPSYGWFLCVPFKSVVW